MRGGGAVEVLRCRFRNGDPALPIRHDVRAALRRSAHLGPGGDWLGDTLLVVSELVQNVSQHTGSHGELVVEVEPRIVRIEVGDTSTTVPRVRPATVDGVGGRGLSLIEALCQQWGVRTCPAGKIVWVQLVTAAGIA